MRSISMSVPKGLALLSAMMTVALALPLQAQVARLELHTINSQSPTDQEFLIGRVDGKAVTISGELRLPRPGTDALPAIVLLHGSGGVTGLVDNWAREFNSLGVATFIVDSFTGRGLTNLSDDQDQLGRLAMVTDAYRALELLAKHPRIDPKRILVMGWSRGGGAAHWAAIKRFRVMYGPPGDLEFAGYIALYPTCNWYFSKGLQLERKPVRIFHGSSDDYVPVKSCRAFVERQKEAGNDVELTEYAGAYHVFDAPAFKTPLKLPNAQTTRNCPDLEEDSEGHIVNSVTKLPFKYASDPCVERGATLAYDPTAHAAAVKAIKEFVSSTLKP